MTNGCHETDEDAILATAPAPCHLHHDTRHDVAIDLRAGETTTIRADLSAPSARRTTVEAMITVLHLPSVVTVVHLLNPPMIRQYRKALFEVKQSSSE